MTIFILTWLSFVLLVAVNESICPNHNDPCSLVFVINFYANMLIIVNFITLFVNRERLVAGLSSITKTHRIVCRVPIKVPLHFNVYIVLSLFAFFGVVIFLADQRYEFIKTLHLMWYYVKINSICFIPIVFCILLEIAGQCFSAMEQQLLLVDESDRSRLIVALVAVYDKLVDDSMVLNRCFAMQIMLVLILYVSIIITNLFEFISGSFTTVRLQAMFIMFAAKVQQFASLIFVFSTCESVTDKVSMSLYDG